MARVRPVSDVLGGDAHAAIIDADGCRFVSAVLSGYVGLARELGRPVHWPDDLFEHVVRPLTVIADNANRARVRSGVRLASVTPDMSGSSVTLDTMNTKQIAEALGVTDRQARRIAARTGSKVGGTWVVPAAAVTKAS